MPSLQKRDWPRLLVLLHERLQRSLREEIKIVEDALCTYVLMYGSSLLLVVVMLVLTRVISAPTGLTGWCSRSDPVYVGSRW